MKYLNCSSIDRIKPRTAGFKRNDRDDLPDLFKVNIDSTLWIIRVRGQKTLKTSGSKPGISRRFQQWYDSHDDFLLTFEI